MEMDAVNLNIERELAQDWSTNYHQNDGGLQGANVLRHILTKKEIYGHPMDTWNDHTKYRDPCNGWDGCTVHPGFLTMVHIAIAGI